MDSERRFPAFQNLLKMFGLSNTPIVPQGEDDSIQEADEDPDQVTELRSTYHQDHRYTKAMAPPVISRRESLLTRAIMGTDNSHELSLSVSSHDVPRALSTASSQSIPSTAELTSDGDLTSPARSASPSPPLLATHLPPIHMSKPLPGSNRVVIAPVTKDDKPDVADVGEAAVEKSLGRKRCIMFACSDKSSIPSKDASPAPVATKEETKLESVPRRSRLTFICPTRQDSNTFKKPASVTQPTITATKLILEATTEMNKSVQKPARKAHLTVPEFSEFGHSQDETDAWIDQPEPVGPKLTLDDCNKKENAIRQIAKEAEEEAEEEQNDQDALEDELDEDDHNLADDFAPSDEESDDGNQSDDEGGFAESDEESDDGSEYRFWAPSTTTATTSVDNLTHFSSRQRSRASSLDSAESEEAIAHPAKLSRKISKAIKMRPATPELPDSTDFVCGTLDEDRPLEAAFIAIREQKKREKHVLIPQDIDPSFPTSDPEDNDDEDGDFSQNSAEPHWLKDQFAGMDEESRGRRPSAFKVSPVHSPPVVRPEPVRPNTVKRNTNRSPPPPKHRSPPPLRRFFERTHNDLRSPPPSGRYRSPRGSPTNLKMPIGITINRLAQRPSTTRTASLPQTPNPFFRNWKNGSPVTSRIQSAAVLPGIVVDEPRPDLHVRGPVDIVIGLEKKRQKRKEKFWRQHCRKAAKEQAERKPIPGRGVERMKELGLECAERTRGYGLGQQARLVLSL